MISRDQVRAADAFRQVESHHRSSPGNAADYLGLARRLPVIFQTNGLLAGWAHLLAKGRTEHRAVARALLAHFRHPAIHLLEEGEADDAEAVFRRWIGPDDPVGTRDLQALTAEAVTFAGWLKRAAEALLAGADTGNRGGGGAGGRGRER